MYELSRQLTSFNVAEFQFRDGSLVPRELKAGALLELVPEPDNPYDPEAVAPRYHGTKLGYVRRTRTPRSR